jgi:hypothetical protein
LGNKPESGNVDKIKDETIAIQAKLHSKTA